MNTANDQFSEFEQKIPEDDDCDFDSVDLFCEKVESFNKSCSKISRKSKSLLKKGEKLQERASNILKLDETQWKKWDPQQLILYVFELDLILIKFLIF